ncbi:ArnT family glycosyltransferase [Flavihumibacter sp. UBA7668]|uniref:ArnT family glycosyltransferase n=1 Tax=Flavihumibacter sp. UBA7668 TaxID=1946542 RepID=UPI0025C40A30|nr:hypothetical protein [Flavihumibacter sp. UBA7668]
MNPPPFKKQLPVVVNERWVLLFCLFFLLLHHWLANLGFYGMDDINYARYAATLTQGDFNWFTSSDHFAHRWLPIIITGFFYWLFGINDFTSALFGILSTLGTCWAILQLSRKSGRTIQTFSAVLFLLTYSALFASHRLWPDSGIAFFFLTALNSYLNFSAENYRKHAIWFTICLFAIFLSKETIILFIPLLVFIFLKDTINGQHKKWWKTSIITGSILALIYFGSYWYFAGNGLFRYQVLLNNNYENSCTFNLLPFIYTLKRIGYELWLSFLKNSDALVLIPAICALLYRKKINSNLNPPGISLYFLILLLSSNFMSLSYSSYIPLCQDPRHFMFLIPLSAIISSNFLIRYFESPAEFNLLPLFYLIAFLTLYLINAGEIKFIYLLIFLFLLLNRFVQKTTFPIKNVGISLILFSGIFLIRPLFDFIKPTYPQFEEHKKLANYIQNEAISKKDTVMVYTNDSFTTEMNEYFLKFENKAVSTLTLSKENNLADSANSQFLIINKAPLDPGSDLSYQQNINNNLTIDTIKETSQFLLLKISK